MGTVCRGDTGLNRLLDRDRRHLLVRVLVERKPRSDYRTTSGNRMPRRFSPAASSFRRVRLNRVPPGGQASRGTRRLRPCSSMVCSYVLTDRCVSTGRMNEPSGERRRNRTSTRASQGLRRDSVKSPKATGLRGSQSKARHFPKLTLDSSECLFDRTDAFERHCAPPQSA